MGLATSRNRGSLAAIGFAALFVGCAGPNAQVARCQTEKQELLAVIEQEKLRGKALEERALALESRLDQSEKQLAQLVRPGSRFAGDEETRTASSKSARPLDLPSHLPGSSVREPKPEPAAEGDGRPRSTVREMKLSAPVSGRSDAGNNLASLAERDPRLVYDEASGTARFQVALSFDGSGAELTAEGKRRLDEVASWLKSPQTSHLRVLVAGHSANMKRSPSGAEVSRFDNDRQLAAARALAVADYLDRRGIKEDRLAVIGSGARTAASVTGATGIEILLSEPQTPIAGLPPTAIRR